MEKAERRERKYKQLLDDIQETRRSWKLTEGALNLTLWRTRFGRVSGPNIRQNTWRRCVVMFPVLSCYIQLYNFQKSSHDFVNIKYCMWNS